MARRLGERRVDDRVLDNHLTHRVTFLHLHSLRDIHIEGTRSLPPHYCALLGSGRRRGPTIGQQERIVNRRLLKPLCAVSVAFWVRALGYVSSFSRQSIESSNKAVTDRKVLVTSHPHLASGGR